jgi:hypothetical protein
MGGAQSVPVSDGLWQHRDVARGAMKAGAVWSSEDSEAIRDTLNGWHIVVALGQAGHPGLAALGAPQLFVPIIDRRHARNNKAVCVFVSSVPDRNFAKSTGNMPQRTRLSSHPFTGTLAHPT